MTRRCRVAATVFALGLLMLAPASAQQADGGGEVVRTVVAGIPDPWPPYYSIDRSGEPKGFGIDVMNALARRIGVKVTYRAFQAFAEAEEAFAAGEIDLIPMSAIRDDGALYTRPVDVLSIAVILREETRDVHSAADLAGRPVGMTEFGARALRPPEGVRLVAYKDVEKALWALLSGSLDAVIYPKSVFLHLAGLAGVEDRIRALDQPLSEVKRGIRIRPDLPDLRNALDAEIAPFLASDEFRRIYAQWFAPAPYWTTGRVALWGGVGLLLIIALLIAWRFHSVIGLNRDLREANRALTESETRFRTLLDESPDAVEVHQNGIIVYANERMAQLLGYDSPEDLIGVGSLDTLPPEDREAVLDRRARRAAGEQFGLIEGRNLRRDGTAVNVERSSVVTTWQGAPAHLLVMRDISERRAVQAEREQLLSALDYLPEAVALFDAEERFVAWNSRFTPPSEEARALLRKGAKFEEYLRGRAAIGDLPDDRKNDPEAWVRERLELFRNHEGPFEMDIRGEWRQAWNRRLPNGGVVLISADISVLKQREQALQQSEAQLRSIFDAGGASIIVADAEHGYLMVNKAFCDFTGYTEEELYRMKPADLALPEDRPLVVDRVRRLVEGEYPGYEGERRYLRKDGTIRWALATARAVHTPGSEQRLFVRIIQDITDRKKAEAALQASEARFRSIFEAGGTGVNLVSFEGRYLAVNPAFCDFLGYSEDELLQMGPPDVALPDDREQLEARMRRLFSGDIRGYHVERRYLHKNGQILWGVVHLSAISDPGRGGPIVVNIVQDITDRKRAEEALALSETRFRDFAEAASDSLWEMGPDLRFTWFSGRSDPLAEIPQEARLGRHRWEFADADDLEQGAAKWAAHRADMQAHRPFRNFEYAARNAVGQLCHISVSGKPIFDSSGMFQGYRGTATDITERIMATEEIRRLVDAIEAMNEGVLLLDGNDRILYSNEVFRARNRAIEAHIRPGTSFRDFLTIYVRRGGVPEAVGNEEEWLAKRLERHANPSGQFELRSLDGTPLLVTEKRLAGGGTVIVTTDITTLKQTEEQLAQSQKMEAVGQLTGGVAHDFNNLLTVVLGNLNLLRDRFEIGSPEYKMVLPAIRAAERGATLTGRLLAFSRRQTLTPSVVSAGKIISDMTALLRRVLGENIEIETVIDGGLWACEVDPLQLENALLNMALNARDAMPEGGKLTIEAGNSRLDDNYAAVQIDVAPGQYVVISITDTGTGMPPEVRSRVFDPFFTTKEVGRGTGLGLSMVYGFVKQSGGHIAVYSEPGEGTTFKIYLPRVTRPTERRRPDPGTVGDESGQGERILLVEDDTDVRVLTVSMLKELGYQVIDADSARSALELVDEDTEIDLLLTDVVLPGGTSGRELAEKLARMRPGLRVLYMSGYTENAIIHHGRLDEGIQLLQKPFRKLDLQRKVRIALDRDASGAN